METDSPRGGRPGVVWQDVPNVQGRARQYGSNGVWGLCRGEHSRPAVNVETSAYNFQRSARNAQRFRSTPDRLVEEGRDQSHRESERCTLPGPRKRILLIRLDPGVQEDLSFAHCRGLKMLQPAADSIADLLLVGSVFLVRRRRGTSFDDAELSQSRVGRERFDDFLRVCCLNHVIRS